MLPSGHIAAGYLVTLSAAAALGSAIPDLHKSSMLAFGAFAGFLPDLDMFYAFYQQKSFYLEKRHRYYNSHAPLVYLLAALLIGLGGLAAGSTTVQAIAIIFLLGTWSHFLLDSSNIGIKWLWPFSDKNWSLYRGKPIDVPHTGYLKHWWEFLKAYAGRPEFYLETLIILIALVLFIKG